MLSRLLGCWLISCSALGSLGAKPSDLPMDVLIECRPEPDAGYEADRPVIVELEALAEDGKFRSRDLTDVVHELEDLYEQLLDRVTDWWLPHMIRSDMGETSTHGLRVACRIWPVKECPDCVEPIVADRKPSVPSQTPACCGNTKCDSAVIQIQRMARARQLLLQAERLVRLGRLEAACELYDQVARLCPGTRYADYANRCLVQAKVIRALRSNDSAEECEENDLQRRLNMPILVDFDQVPLRKVMIQLQDLTGVQLAIPEDCGCDLDQLVTLRVRQMPLRDALRVLLESAGLRLEIKEREVLITTSTKMRGMPMSRAYHVQDLVAGPNFEQKSRDLKRFVMSMIAPSSWMGQGGSGTLDCRGGSLVVAQSPDVHKEINELLTCLRSIKQRESARVIQEKRANDQRVDVLMKACHQAVHEGDTEKATRLAQQALALDPACVEAHPLVYRALLLNHCNIPGKPNADGVLVIEILEHGSSAEEQEQKPIKRTIKKFYVPAPPSNLEVK